MCKIAAAAGITDKNRDQVWIFMMSLGEVMSVYNDHGLGYAAFNKNNQIFGERWLLNHTAFRDFSKMKDLTAKKAAEIYNFFGEKVARDEAKSIILHTRMATCAYGLKNTHPFVDNQDDPQMALIHNGVISNHYKFKKKYSTCDSEIIIHNYAEAEVNKKLDNLSNFTPKMEGWYTCAVLAKDKQNKPILDLFTDSGTRLSSFFIPELGVRVYSTNAGDIQRIARKYGYTCEDPIRLQDDTALRVNVDTGELIEKTSFVARTWEPMYPNVHHMSGNFDDGYMDWEGWLRRGGDHD